MTRLTAKCAVSDDTQMSGLTPSQVMSRDAPTAMSGEALGDRAQTPGDLFLATVRCRLGYLTAIAGPVSL
jgi:hypothetical protein